MKQRTVLPLVTLALLGAAGCGLKIPPCPEPPGWVNTIAPEAYHPAAPNKKAQGKKRQCIEDFNSWLGSQLGVNLSPKEKFRRLAAWPSPELLILQAAAWQTEKRSGWSLSASELSSAIENLSDSPPGAKKSRVREKMKNGDGLLPMLVPERAVKRGYDCRVAAVDYLGNSFGGIERFAATIRIGPVTDPVYERFVFIEIENRFICGDVIYFSTGRSLLEELWPADSEQVKEALEARTRLAAAERDWNIGYVAGFERQLRWCMGRAAVAPTAHLVYAEYLLGRGEAEAAGKTWKAVIESRPWCLPARYSLARLDTMRCDYAAARSIYLEIADITGSDPYPRSLAAMCAGFSGASDLAEKEFGNLLESAGTPLPFIFLHRARYRAAAGNTGGAIEDLRTAAESAPLDGEWLLGRWEFQGLQSLPEFRGILSAAVFPKKEKEEASKPGDGAARKQTR